MRGFIGRISRLLLPLLLVPFILFAQDNLTAQSALDTWGDFINEPEISYGDLRTAQEHLDDKRVVMSIFSHMDCQTQSYPIVSGSSFEQCWYDTSGHKTTEGGQGYVPAGAGSAGFMTNFETLLFPTKHQNTLIEQSAGYDRALIRKDSALEATPVEDPDGNMPNFWQWNNPASLELKNEDGSPFYFHGNYLYAQSTFSNNGRWMLIFDASGYLIRLDLQELTISTFRVAVSSEDFWPAIAISDTGRYIAVNDRVSKFYVMDTEGCSQELGYIKNPSELSSCTRRSLRDYAQEYFASLAELYPDFYSDDIMRVRGIGITGEGDEVYFRAPNTKIGTNYIALGDSYSSGEGAGGYLSGTNAPLINTCHTSRNSYPYLISKSLNLDSVHSVACSGAKLHNIFGGSRLNAAQNRFYPVDQSLGKWLPGYRWQIEHIRDANPAEIVTLGIGGNNIGFSNKVLNCVTKSGSCFNTYEERLSIAIEINKQFDEMVGVFSSVRTAVKNKSPFGKVFVIGYPSIVSSSGYCSLDVRLTDEERLLANDLINFLNRTIKAASDRAGTIFVGIESSLNGNRLCDSSSNKAINGVTPSWITSSYHPNALGHKMIADRILQSTNNLSIRMPRTPDTSMGAPSPLSSSLVSGMSPGGGAIHRLSFGDEVINDIVGVGDKVTGVIGGAAHGVKNGVKSVFSIFSTPTDVGEFVSQENGDIVYDFVIPNSIPPGFHTLHVFTEDTDGNVLDIYKTFYLASSSHDWDGDGIRNELEPCGVFEPAEIDNDNDGIDDGCDGLFSSDNSDTDSMKLAPTNSEENSNISTSIGDEYVESANFTDALSGGADKDSLGSQANASGASGLWVVIVLFFGGALFALQSRMRGKV